VVTLLLMQAAAILGAAEVEAMVTRPAACEYTPLKHFGTCSGAPGGLKLCRSASCFDSMFDLDHPN
jgi:hypothetical protein